MEFAPVLIFAFLLFLVSSFDPPSRFRPIVVLFMAVSLLYIGGLFHLLFYTKVFLWAASAFMAVWILVQRKRALRLEPEAVAVLLFQLFLIYKLRDCRFSHWDEFTNWGPLVSGLLRTDALTTNALKVTFKTYPLGHSLWEYFVMFGDYREPIANASVAIWLTTCLAVAIPRLNLPTRERWSWAFLLIFILYASNYVFGREWQSVYADHVMGVTFGVGLVAAFHFQFLPLLLVLFLLPQLKMLGLVFAMTVLGFAAVMKWMESAAIKKWGFKILGLFALIMVSAYSWKFYCAQEHLTSPFVVNKARLLAETPLQVQILQNTFKMFLKNLFLRPLDNFWPLPVWLLFFGFWSHLLGRTLGKNKFRAVSIYLGFTFYCYLFVLLGLYLALFSDDEAQKLASFERYESPFLYGLLIFLLSVTMQNFSQLAWAKKWLVGLVAMLIIGSPMRAWKFPFADLAQRDELIVLMQNDVDELNKFAMDHQQAKIWGIRTPSQLLEVQYLMYQVPQLDWYEKGFSVVDENFWRDLENIDYVWVSAADSAFWSAIGSSPEHHLFRVLKSEGKRASLQPVQ